MRRRDASATTKIACEDGSLRHYKKRHKKQTAFCALMIFIRAYGSTFESSVESDVAGREVDLADERAGVLRAVFTVHAAVFPFDGERALVADAVQFADDLLEIDTAVARAAEVPAAVRLAEVDMAGKDARLAVERDFRVFDMDVVDAVLGSKLKPNVGR